MFKFGSKFASVGRRLQPATAARSVLALGALACAVAFNTASSDAPQPKKKAHFEAHETIALKAAPKASDAELEAAFAAARPDPKEWVRMDEAVLSSEQMKPFVSKNAFHDTLVGEGMLEQHEIYRRRPTKKGTSSGNQPPRSSTASGGKEATGDAKAADPAAHEEIIALMRYGDALNGHPGVVHGGVLAMTFDNLFGWVFFASKMKAGFTANLNVNFRKPVFAGTVVRIHSRLVEVADRKRYLQATMTDSKDGSVVAEATALFVLPRPPKKPE